MTGERVIRRLAAILAADVVGYSRLMGRDEHGTLTRLKAHRSERLEPVLARHGGRLVKLTGDGALIEFPSAVDALNAAIEFQQAMAEANQDQPAETAIIFRVGLHLGDLIVDGDDLYGDGVNVAARLEAEAPPGGVIVSRAVCEAVEGRLKAKLHALGELTLKNIERPIWAFRVDWDDTDWQPAARSPARHSELDAPTLALPDKPPIDALPISELREAINEPSATAPTVDERSRHLPLGRSAGDRGARPSLAVLPFDNLSHDTETQSFCDGLVEDAITALSRFRWLNVVSRNSSFAQKARSVDIRAIARDLNVRFVLEGSVRKFDRRIRITAQLIDGTSGNHVWAERYDRDYSTLFDLQDEITRDIVASLEYVLWIALARADSHMGAPIPATSPLRAAAWHVAECTHIGNRIAISCATNALEINPKSVAAYQYLANAYIVELFAGWTEAAEADVGNLSETSRRAAALSPADHLSQGLFGCALAFAGRHDDALTCTRRALALNNNSVNVLGPCGHVLSFSGEAREANEMLERMLRLVPAHYFRAGFLSQMALNWFQLGEPERGLPLVSEASKLKPEALCCHIVNATILTALGRSEEAQVAISEVYGHRPDLNKALIRIMFAHRDRSVPNHLAKVLGMA